MPIRSAISTVVYKTIAGGARLPRIKAVADYDQWGSLIELIKRLRINVFLDVGANRGFYSKRLRDSGYRGYLISFERRINSKDDRPQNNRQREKFAHSVFP
jgi:hypothetical protein